jgi:hypothetical protein
MRKDSSFFPNPADHKAILTLSPTKAEARFVPRSDYLRLEERTIEIIVAVSHPLD